jgi:hypothetical protein
MDLVIKKELHENMVVVITLARWTIIIIRLITTTSAITIV